MGVQADSVHQDGHSRENLDLEEGDPGLDMLAGGVAKQGQRYKRCALCEQDLKGLWLECSCGSQSHVDCLAHHFLEASHVLLAIQQRSCVTWFSSFDDFNRHRSDSCSLAKQAVKCRILQA